MEREQETFVLRLPTGFFPERASLILIYLNKGDMELLVRYGTNEQKAQRCLLLLEGKICSCFAMAESQVTSMDGTNIESSREENRGYIISGHQ
ncbi:acyl-CoA dehydrogenase family member 10-like isoform 1-T1 [Sarcophilus harrisii]